MIAMKSATKPAVTRKRPAVKKAVRRPAAPARTAAQSTTGGRLVKIRELGPIAKADIQLRPLTVFSGENGTGKSFACKAIYSFLSAMRENHVEGAFRPWIEGIEIYLKMSPHSQNAYPDNTQTKQELALANEKMDEAVKILERKLSHFPNGDFDDQITNFESDRNLKNACKRIQSVYQEIESITRRSVSKNSVNETSNSATQQEWADTVSKSVSRLSGIPQRSGRSVVADGILVNLLHCLQYNLQATYISPRNSLDFFKTIRSDWIHVDEITIEGYGSLKSGDKANGSTHKFNISQNSRPQRADFSHFVFLDSPVYWRLNDVLTKSRLSRPSGNSTILDGVPQYFYDIAVLLREQFPPSTVHEIFKHLQKIIGGKIVLTETGELRFHPKNTKHKKGHSMLNTAGGIVNLGILSLLIERGIITENTIVFIDEPESNLHQAWQTEMAEVLAQLVRAGVYVVLATHSDWMLSTIANIVRRGELGESDGLRKEQVGVWLFEQTKDGGGSAVREIEFNDTPSYIPGRLCDLSSALQNETADLLDALDEHNQ